MYIICMDIMSFENFIRLVKMVVRKIGLLALLVAAVLCFASGVLAAPSSAMGAKADYSKVVVKFRVADESTGKLRAVVNGKQQIASGDVVDVVEVDAAGNPMKTSVTFMAVPNEGYGKVHWWINGSEIILGSLEDDAYLYNYKFTYPLGGSPSVEVVALFEPAMVRRAVVIFGADGGGKVTALVDGKPIVSGDSVRIGRDIMFTAIPDEGYSNAHWAVTGADDIDDSEEYKLRVGIFGMGEVRVVASFDRLPEPDRAVIVFDEGTLTTTVDGVAIASGDSVDIGKYVSFRVDPGTTDYYVVHWTINGLEFVDSSLTYNYVVRISKAAVINVSVWFDLYPDPPASAMFAVVTVGIVTVGPNPVRAGTDAAIYWIGTKPVSGRLSVFDAGGNWIQNIDDLKGIGKIGTWNVGGDLATGAYLLKGRLRYSNGRSVKVAVRVSVLR